MPRTSKFKANKNDKNALFIDKDRDVMERYYDIVSQKGVSKSELLKQMKQLISEDPDFFDPYIYVSNILTSQKKYDQADSYTCEGYKRVIELISDKEGNLPDKIEWGFLENRHILRMVYDFANMCWNQGKVDETVIILKKILRLNPNDNQGVRYDILAIRLGILKPHAWQDQFMETVFMDGFAASEWFEKNAKKFPEDFREFYAFYGESLE